MFSPNGRTIAALRQGSKVGRGVLLLDVDARKPRDDEPLLIKEGDVESLAFSPDDSTVAAGLNGGLLLLDVATRKRLVRRAAPYER